MPSLRNRRRGLEEKVRRRLLPEKSSSFVGETAEEIAPRIRRPKTAPELRSCRNAVARTTFPSDKLPTLTKLLLNVTIHGSVGPVHVLMSPEATVADLVATSLQQYLKERRRPILPSNDPANFNLHYSKFSLESLEKGEKLGALGSRNFFLCPKKTITNTNTNTKLETMSFLPCESVVKSYDFSCMIMFVDFLFQSQGLA